MNFARKEISRLRAGRGGGEKARSTLILVHTQSLKASKSGRFFFSRSNTWIVIFFFDEYFQINVRRLDVGIDQLINIPPSHVEKVIFF